MNKMLLLLLLLPLINVSLASSIHELEIEKLFVIENGFDSNDDIEVTLHTKLPNACYRLHDAIIKKVGDQTFQVKAYAKKRDLSGCELGLVNTPINITKTVAIGELSTGEYQFSYTTPNGEQSQTMKIKSAVNQTIDDVIYAPISNAFIPELIYPTDNAQVVLTGIFHNSCMDLNSSDIKIIREDNIFIIIPKTHFHNRPNCKSVQSPIRLIVNLGKVINPGPYLVHVRSISGLSVNKVFYISKKNQINRGAL